MIQSSATDRDSISNGQTASLVLAVSMLLVLTALSVAQTFGDAPARTVVAMANPEELQAAAPREETPLVPPTRLTFPVRGLDPAGLRDTFDQGRGKRRHQALDIMAPRGTRVLSVDAGKVWKIRSNNLGGLTVYAIDASERFVYYYAHLDRYAEGLAEGQTVQPGDMIGYVGTTGNAPPNAPHLHFQLLLYRGNGRWWDGEPLNPRQYLARAGRARSQ